MTRTAAEVIAYVNARDGIWSAYDQGRCDFLEGVDRKDDPYGRFLAYRQIDVTDWQRGWDFEENYMI